MKRLIGRIICALDPNEHPGFRGTTVCRLPTFVGRQLVGGPAFFTRHYARWTCVRCGTEMWDQEVATALSS